MEQFTTEIKPKDKLFNLDLGGIWSKRYLLWLFIKRDILVQFKQTIFGLAWYFISPLVSTAIYIIIFSRVAGIPTDGIPEPLFYLSGQCLWNYFSQCLTKVSSTFTSNADLFGKVYFPRLIMPISQVVSHLFRFSIQLTLFVIVYVIYAVKGVDIAPNIYLLMFPVLVLMIDGLAIGLGLIVTSMTTKYRDLNNFFGLFVSLWMYATPIVYPMSVIENETLKNIMRLNPLTSIVEAFKYGTMGAGEFSWGWLAYRFGFIMVLLLLGMLMFNRKQKLFIDTI